MIKLNVLLSRKIFLISYSLIESLFANHKNNVILQMKKNKKISSWITKKNMALTQKPFMQVQ